MRLEFESQDKQPMLAVLIDADNAQPAVIEALLAEVAKFGIASVKRIYGDWTSPQTKQWKKCLLQHSINPMQQFPYTTGKNATDSALIIDAMDLLYTRRFDGFCLVSSDSDFTRLAQRLREEGLKVYGFGEQKTPEAFVAACDKFISTEILRTIVMEPDAVVSSSPKQSAKTPVPSPPQTVVDIPAKPDKVSLSDPPVDFIAQAIKELSDDTGWVFLANLGSYLTNLQPGFDPRLYGSQTLSKLLKKFPGVFQLQERDSPKGTGKDLYVRACKPGETANPSK